MLVNLRKNDFEAMRDAGVDPKAISITLHLASYCAMAHVTMRDIGPGLDEPTLQRIFGPFVTTRSSGIGMGLPINRAIIGAHGGRLWVGPVEAGGTSSRFTQPISS